MRSGHFTIIIVVQSFTKIVIKLFRCLCLCVPLLHSKEEVCETRSIATLVRRGIGRLIYVIKCIYVIVTRAVFATSTFKYIITIMARLDALLWTVPLSLVHSASPQFVRPSLHSSDSVSPRLHKPSRFVNLSKWRTLGQRVFIKT